LVSLRLAEASLVSLPHSIRERKSVTAIGLVTLFRFQNEGDSNFSFGGVMSQYKYPQFLKQNTNAAFDSLHTPGTTTPYSGIYRCYVCGKEDVSTEGHPLPPQNHHQHPAGGDPIRWQLIVSH
jgi:hypothetical protein